MILHGGRASKIKKGVGKPRLQVVGRLCGAEALSDARLMCGKDAIPVRLVRGGLILDGALGARAQPSRASVVSLTSNLGDRAPAERKRDVLLELAQKNVRR